MFLQLSNALNKSHKIARYHYYAYCIFDFLYKLLQLHKFPKGDIREISKYIV